MKSAWSRRVLCLVVLLAWWRPGTTCAGQADGSWESLELPGSAASLAAAVGIDPATPRARLLLEVVRAAHATPPGQSAEVDAARGRLEDWLATVHPPDGTGGAADAIDSSHADGPGVAVHSQHRLVPQPIPEHTWRAVLGLQGEGRGTLAAALLWDRNAALVYFGLMGTDRPTRAYFASRPKLLTAIYERHASIFAAFGRSLRIDGGRLALAGGAAAEPIWEDLAGVRPSATDAFVRAVLGRRRGRLAFFFDTVTHLDEPRRRFALSASQPDPATRLDRVRALARAFFDGHPEWVVAERPFARPSLDASLVLLAVSVTEDGELAPPAMRAFWENVFGGPVSGARGSADAAWLVERVLSGDLRAGRERLGAIGFVQRSFRDVAPERLPDVAAAARGFMETRTMVVALERMGVTDPSVFARAVAHASRLSRIPAPGIAASSLAQFQAACVILERLRARQALSRERAASLVTSLLDLPLGERGEYSGGMAAWLLDELLPLIGGAAHADGAERIALEALAGRPRGFAAATRVPRVTWEGLEYDVDLAGAELARLERIRARQYGNRLDGALAFAGAVGRVANGHSEACDALLADAAGLQPVSWPAPGLGAPPSPIDALARPPCDQLRKQGGSSGRVGAELVAVADAVLADTLMSIVYALHVGEPAGAVDLAPDLARRHRYQLESRDPARRARAVWGLPEEWVGAGHPWHVTGSLLGLEHGLGKLALRFLFGEMPVQPRMNDNERRTLALGLALLNPLELEDRDRDAIVEALARGRVRLASAASVSENLDALAAAAGWSGWRRETIGWAAACDPESLAALFTLTDYFWTGQAGPGGANGLDAWGAPTTPLDGDLRLAWPLARPWEELSGRAANGQLATRFVDMTLRIAETLARFRLPAGLAAGTLAPALADLIHEAPLGHDDDWYALAGYASRLPDDRLFDYIAALAAGGPLVPPDAADGHHRPGP